MFSLKISEDVIPKCIEGLILDAGDRLKVQYMTADGRSIEKEEILTIETIKHYNGDLFLLTFKEQKGSYSFNLNQLIHFKLNMDMDICIFDKNKIYIFDKELALKNDKNLEKNYKSGNSKFWVDCCDGKKVTNMNGYTGYIDGGANYYTIDPKWCKEVTE